MNHTASDLSPQPSTTGSAPPAAANGSLVGRVSALLKRHKSAIRVIMLILIAAFLIAGVWKSWSAIAHTGWSLSSVQWSLLLAGFALLIAQEASYAFIWRSILARLGSPLDIVSSQRIYLGAEFVRYIPGNVWHVITRVLWAEQRGVPKSVGLASMVIELATKIASAALVFALSLFFWPNAQALALTIPRQNLIAIGGVALPLLLLGLYPPFLSGLLNLGLKKLGRQPVRFTLRYTDTLLISAYWAASWLIAGLGFYLLIRSIYPGPYLLTSGPAIAIAIGAYAIGWDIGFLSFITPSGVGFREAAIVILLTTSGLIPPQAQALALIIAFAARLLATGAELLCIAAAHLAPGVPLLPQAELARRSASDPSDTGAA